MAGAMLPSPLAMFTARSQPSGVAIALPYWSLTLAVMLHSAPLSVAAASIDAGTGADQTWPISLAVIAVYPPRTSK